MPIFLKRILFGFAATAFITKTIAAPSTANPNRLWYDKPATKWVQALPVGNGRLGAMIFGQPASDRLQLNEVTIWSGHPQPDADRSDAYKSLPELRQLIRDGKYAEAEQFANANFNGPAPYKASYQMLGDLKLEFQLPDGAVTNYSRWLDIDSALAGVEFTVGKTKFQREIFSSAPDQVLVERLTSSTKGGLNFTMKLSRPASARIQVVGNDTLVMTGNTDMPSLKGNLEYEADARILVKGGKVSGAGDGLKVEGANEAVVLLTCGTSFALDYANGYRGADPHAPRGSWKRRRKSPTPDSNLRTSPITRNIFTASALMLALSTRQNCRPMPD